MEYPIQLLGLAPSSWMELILRLHFRWELMERLTIISMSLSNMDSASLGLGAHNRGPDNVADTALDPILTLFQWMVMVTKYSKVTTQT